MRPAREKVSRSGQTYFVSSQTVERKPFFRHERWAVLLQHVLQHYRGTSYLLHAYVIMPDHFHILLSPQESLERSMQNIKGGFSFRARSTFQWRHDIWQVGFSDHRIRDVEDWERHIAYMRHNPVKNGCCSTAEDYPYLALNLDPLPQRLKPLDLVSFDGGAKAPPLREQAKAPPLQEQAKAPPLREQAKAPPLQEQAKAPPLQKKAPENAPAEAQALQKQDER